MHMSKLPRHIPPTMLGKSTFQPLIADSLQQQQVDSIVSPPSLD